MKKEHGFMRDSMRILFCIGIIILVAFILNFVIIQNKYQEESIRQREKLFAETLQRVEEETTDIDRIIMSAISNQNISDYMDAENLSERWNRIEKTKTFASNLTTLNDSIIAVCIYDENNEIIAMHGAKYTPAPDIIWEDVYKFSNKVSMKDDLNTYFYAAVPVFVKMPNRTYEKEGGVALLVNTVRIQEILEFATSGYQNQEVYFAVVDRQGEILASAGSQNLYEAYQKSSKGSKNYLYYEDKLVLSEWELVSVTHKNSYMGYMNYVQGINIATYIGVIAALIILWYMMYFHVIVPLKRQMNFVMNYTKDTSRRMRTGDKYEVGKLEKELNEMLDGIEELNRRILEEKERYQRLEYEKKQTEIIAYKDQINPHFLHNTLECIRGMALYKGEIEIAKLTEAMSRMFQYNIRGGEIVSVRDMIHSILDYRVIIEYRFMGKIKIEVKVEETVKDCMLPKMLIQPLVENAVRHGVQRRVEGGTIDLMISDQGEWFQIRIVDTGVGMDAETCARQQAKFYQDFNKEILGTARKEIGISNVARRLQLFYEENYEVKLKSTKDEGTEISILLPKKIPE